MPLFSKREGFSQPNPIRFRDDLSAELRKPICEILIKYLPVPFLLERAKALFNPYGTDTMPFYAGPVDVSKTGDGVDAILFKRALLGCDWYRIYDVLEDAFSQLVFHEDELAEPGEETRSAPLQKELNAYFVHVGIGWKMVSGRVTTRLDEATETATTTAIETLTRSQRPTAAKHIASALRALSERPSPNTAGAVAHATSSVECVLGQISGENLTLGKHLDRFSTLHPALKKALDGVYGFASDSGARHGKEGKQPTTEEAIFAVTTCAAACILLDGEAHSS